MPSRLLAGSATSNGSTPSSGSGSTPSNDDYRRLDSRLHLAIVFAILAGNEQGAVEAMHEHLEASAVLLRGFLA